MRGAGHLFFAYFAFLGGLVVSFLVTGGASLIGRADPLLEKASGEPLWIPEIAIGFAAGSYLYSRLPSKVAYFSWCIPGLLLLCSAWHWQSTMAIYDSTWQTYFGKGCGGSECLYELALTAPFYTSVAYSVGALVQTVRFARLQG